MNFFQHTKAFQIAVAIQSIWTVVLMVGGQNFQDTSQKKMHVCLIFIKCRKIMCRDKDSLFKKMAAYI